MSADYDLVILGGTLEGRYAAAMAVSYGARVALIESPGLFAQRQQARYLLKGVQQLAEGRERQRVSEWFLPAATANTAVKATEGKATLAELDWSALVRWSAIAAETQCPQFSAEALSASGVDLIFAEPKQLSHELIVTVADRQLSTRAVLAAFGMVPGDFVDPDDLSDRLPMTAVTGLEPLIRAKQLPREIYVWGHSLETVAWASALNSLGVKVTLVTDRFLRQEDSEIRERVRSQLIAAGVTFDRSAALQPAETCILQLARRKPAIVLPDFVYPPYSQYQGIDARIPERPYLLSNGHLQTAHPRVFACGSLLRGNNTHFAVARHEAAMAVWNALFWPRKRVDYGAIAQGYSRIAIAGRAPKFAKIGHAPPKGYRIWSAAAPNSADLQRVIPQPLYCKLICKRDRLQSIHLLGDGAGELIEPLAAAIGQPVTTLLDTADYDTVSPMTEALMDVVRTAAKQSVLTRWQPGHWRRDWAENWFNWRRSRDR